MAPKIPRSAEILRRAGVLDEFQLKSALAHFEKWGGRFTKAVDDLRMASEPRVVSAICEAMRLQPADLETMSREAFALNRVDADTCTALGVIPCALKDKGKTLWIAMADPTDSRIAMQLEEKTRCRLVILVAGEQAIRRAISRHYFGVEAPPVTNGAMPAAQSSGIELEYAGTGEYMDAKGEVLGRMRHETGGHALPEEDRFPTAPPRRPSTSAAASSFGTPKPATPKPAPMPVARPAEPSAALVARMEQLQTNQENSLLILRTVLGLCQDKGLFGEEDLARMRAARDAG